MNDFSHIKAILFDVGQTFLYPDFPFLKNLLAEYGVATDIETLNHGAATAREKIFRYREVERWQEFFACWMEFAGAPEQKIPEILPRIFARHKREHLWNWLDPTAPEVFAGLKKLGYPLGLISNSDGSIAGSMKKLGLSHFFDCIIDSHVVGVEKPDPRIFQIALAQIGLPAAQCVYIGDNYDRDVIGARRAGLTPMLLDPFGVVSENDVLKVKQLSELVEMFQRYPQH